MVFYKNKVLKNEMNESALTVTKKKDFKDPLDSKHSQHVIIHHEYVVNSPEHQDYLLSVPQVFFFLSFSFCNPITSIFGFIQCSRMLQSYSANFCNLLQLHILFRIKNEVCSEFSSLFEKIQLFYAYNMLNNVIFEDVGRALADVSWARVCVKVDTVGE